MKRYLPPRRRRVSQTQPRPAGGNRLAICLILCALTLVCKFYYPQSVTALQDLILGAEGSRITQAVQAMSDALGDGHGLSQAVEAFWQGMGHDSPT